MHNSTNSKCLSCDWQFHLLLRGNDKTDILRLPPRRRIFLFFWISLPRLCHFNFNNTSLHLSCWFSFVRPTTHVHRYYVCVTFVTNYIDKTLSESVCTIISSSIRVFILSLSDSIVPPASIVSKLLQCTFTYVRRG